MSRAALPLRAGLLLAVLALPAQAQALSLSLSLPWSRTAEAQPAPPPRPVVSEVLSDHASRPRAVPGSVVARNEVALAFQTLGRVIARPVELGDLVDADAILARLDPEDLDGQVRAAEAAVAAAQAQFDATLATATRTRFLATREVASTAMLEQVENALAAANATLQQAQSQLIRARDQQGFAELTAPFDGVISAIWAEPGEVVQAGAPVVTLSGRNMREAIIDLTEAELAGMTPGTPWTVWQEADPQARFAAPVDRIAPLADSRTRTRRVHLSLPHEAPFRLGSLIRATRDDRGGQDLTLPAAAILQEGSEGTLHEGAATVWVVSRPMPGAATGTVARQPVTIAPRADGRVDVTGLAAGTEVVIRGIHSLTEGQTVAQGVAP